MYINISIDWVSIFLKYIHKYNIYIYIYIWIYLMTYAFFYICWIIPCWVYNFCLFFFTHVGVLQCDVLSHLTHRFYRGKSKPFFGHCAKHSQLSKRSQHRVMNKKKFAALEQALGVNYTPHGILFDVELRRYLKPVSVLQFDWLHCLLVQGIFPHEMNLALAELKSHGFGQTQIHDFLYLGC